MSRQKKPPLCNPADCWHCVYSDCRAPMGFQWTPAERATTAWIGKHKVDGKKGRFEDGYYKNGRCSIRA